MEDPLSIEIECKRNRERANRDVAKCGTKGAKGRAQKLKATPSWLTKDHKEQILQKYQRAANLESETGKVYEVDHIVPLLSDRIFGLHVPWKLQVLTLFGNRSKGNNFD